jgi:hypothetical protein
VDTDPDFSDSNSSIEQRSKWGDPVEYKLQYLTLNDEVARCTKINIRYSLIISGKL